MTATSGDALSHVLLAVNPDAIFQAIDDRNSVGRAGSKRRPLAAAVKFVPPRNAWVHAPFAGTPAAPESFHYRITCANLVIADDDYIRRYF
jgi:hypothetical protein